MISCGSAGSSRRWMQGELSDEALIEEVKHNYLTLIGYWREARR
ncbi:DUF2090 domain-containing protein [Pseudomonas aeruginosa]|nr:DUF2090 domain-containing protein [Pseudomonas aeruginosa]